MQATWISELPLENIQKVLSIKELRSSNANICLGTGKSLMIVGVPDTEQNRQLIKELRATGYFCVARSPLGPTKLINFVMELSCGVEKAEVIELLVDEGLVLHPGEDGPWFTFR